MPKLFTRLVWIIALFPLFALADDEAFGPAEPEREDLAFGAPGNAFPWATSEKQGAGTAYDRGSKVWFTIARGIVTEVFYPRIDWAQTRDTQIVITDGKSLFWEEQYHLNHEVKRKPGAPFYTVINREPNGRFTIEKEIWSDPDSNTLIQKIRIRNFTEGLKFYLVHKPAARNSLFGDSAYAMPLVAGEKDNWHSVRATIPFRKTSVGYLGHSDGYADLTKNHQLTRLFHRATDGNVAMVAELETPRQPSIVDFTLFTAFGETKEAADESYSTVVNLDTDRSKERFFSQWGDYLSGLDLPIRPGDSARRKALAEGSALVIKSSEDKTYPGSIIASMSNPWGEKSVEVGPSADPNNNPSYHVVWPRDLYHTGMGLMAIGDKATARSIFFRLREMQFKAGSGDWHFGPRRHSREGSFAQNYWVDSRPVYWGYQGDQTGMPVILSYRLWKAGIITADEAWEVVGPGGAFLYAMGPWTQNERWEETYGISPNTAAYVISGLSVASELAFAVGKSELAATWLKTADAWAMKPNDNIDTWTFTTKGRIGAPFGNGKYYLRLAGNEVDKGTGNSIWDAIWDPNKDSWIKLANFTGEEAFRRETEVVDHGFLALVRLGVRAAKSPKVLDSLPEIDAMLKTETPKGPGWHRYRFDGYGEEKRGRLWPLLTGERLHFELELGREIDLEKATSDFENFANPQGLFSEQVWDDGPLAGVQNGSACPLTWSHSEYLEWLRSRYDGRVFEELASVKAKYAQ